MKLSELIKKYEPLGWTFEYTKTSLDDFWTFKSPRMNDRRGFKEHRFGGENDFDQEFNEEKMLEYERNYYIFNTYSTKIVKGFDSVIKDIFRQLEILDKHKAEIPNEIKVEFTLKLK